MDYSPKQDWGGDIHSIEVTESATKLLSRRRLPLGQGILFRD